MQYRPSRQTPLVLLCTFGSLGDLRPFMRLATALRHRGHRVLLIAPTFHQREVLDSGLPHAFYGSVADGDTVLADPDIWHSRRGVAVVLRAVVASVAAVSALIAERLAAEPCLLIGHPLLLPAADIARAAIAGAANAHLPTIGAWLAPSNLRTCDDPLTIGPLAVPSWVPMAVRRGAWAMVDRFGVDPFVLPGLNALRADVGLRPLGRFMPHLCDACDASVALFPAWFGPGRHGWPQAFVEGEFPLDEVEHAAPMSPGLTAFLNAGPSPVVFTAGTGMRQAAAFFVTAQAALQRLGRRGVFVTSHAAQLPPMLAADIHAEPFVDFARLFPRAATVVHHGGIGTTAEALRAGTPQLVTPFGFDQFDNGHRVQALGVGAMLPATRLDPRRLEQAIEPLLRSAEVSAACRAVADRFFGVRVLRRLVDQVEVAMSLADRRRRERSVEPSVAAR